MTLSGISPTYCPWACNNTRAQHCLKLIICEVNITACFNTSYSCATHSVSGLDPWIINHNQSSSQGVKKSHYDVVVVGAGPAGATLSYFLSKMGRRVLLLEKKAFPRDKICGDALVKTAIEILKEMGVLEKLMKEKRAHVVCHMIAT